MIYTGQCESHVINYNNKCGLFICTNIKQVTNQTVELTCICMCTTRCSLDNIDRRMKKIYILLTASTISLGYPKGKYCLINFVSFFSRFIYLIFCTNVACMLSILLANSPVLPFSPLTPPISLFVP